MTCPFITSDNLSDDRIKHGFFTRQGGVSPAPFDTLNCGFNTDDTADNIAQNVMLVAQNMQTESIYMANQVHGDHIVHVTRPIDLNNRPKADGLITNQPDMALGILTADCGPVLFMDPVNRIIGAAHLGRKGVFLNLFSKMIHAMCDLGAQRQHIKAALGPMIQACHYEVDQAIFEEMQKKSLYKPEYLKPIPQKEGFYFLNLPLMITDQAASEQVAFEDLGLCTYAEPQRFFSYRYATHKGHKTGRNISVISL